MNFLKETIEHIATINQTSDKIVYIGSLSGKHSCSWNEFEKIANFEYDNGYGHCYIPLNLTIQFADGCIMYRHEYDGAEWWRTIYLVKPKCDTKPLKELSDLLE